MRKPVFLGVAMVFCSGQLCVPPTGLFFPFGTAGTLTTCDPNVDPNCTGGGGCDPTIDPNCSGTSLIGCDPVTDPTCVANCDPRTDPNCNTGCDPTIDPTCATPWSIRTVSL